MAGQTSRTNLAVERAYPPRAGRHRHHRRPVPHHRRHQGTTIGLRNASSQAECCDLCVSTAGCVAWTFHGKIGDECWLTAHPVAPHYSKGALSGSTRALPPTPPPSPPHPHGGKPEQAPLPVLLQQELRRGYYASVSFTDHNVGRVLDALDALPGLKQNTAVLFVSHPAHVPPAPPACSHGCL